MASNINWASLGANLPRAYQEQHDAYSLNADAFGKGLDSVGNVFDRWNREKALGKSASERIAAQKAKIDSLREKLDGLKQELAQAQERVIPQYYDSTERQVPQTDKGGYHASVISQSSEQPVMNYPNLLGVTNDPGYVPDEARNQAYSNAYAMLGAGRPNVRF